MDSRFPEINPSSLIDLGRLNRQADKHLINWARWMRRYEVGIGYRHRSTLLIGDGVEPDDSSLDDVDSYTARISDAVIESLELIHRCAIHNVYLNSVFSFKRLDPIATFLDAAELFWVKAQRRGLT